MGWVMMSERELNRIEVLAQVDEGRLAASKLVVKLASKKNGYVKTGRRPPGRPSKMDAYYARKRTEREAAIAPGEA